MYCFKLSKEEKEKLLDGRTATYYANKIGISPSNFIAILNKNRGCGRMTAYAITKTINSEFEVNDLFEIKK